MSDFKPHQISTGEAVLALIRQYGMAYIAGEPRSGKTRTAFYVANHLPVKQVMFITKKNAIPGIVEQAPTCTKPVTVINYEQITKYNADDYDFVIVDEAHNIGTVGKPSLRFKELKAFCWEKQVLLLSGTPMVESPNASYYQFGICKHTPLPFKTFYVFFKTWGVPSPMFYYGRTIESYKKAKPELLALVGQYTVTLTQDQAGITAKAEDVVHELVLQPSTIDLIGQLRKHSIAIIDGDEIVCESEAAVRALVHQIESGAALIDDEFVMLPNTEMVDYIRDTFGDNSDVAVMCHFRATAAKVAKHLPNVHIYSAEGHKEGVDLSHYKHFIIANTGYSGSGHIQRRDRGTRMDVTAPRKVHHLIVPGQLSELVYDAVSQKMSFNIQHFREFCKRA